MPGRPIPTAIKKARGTFRKCRQKGVEPEYPDDNNPNPPEYLSAIAKDEWRRIYTMLTEKQVLKTVDRRTLEGYCEAYGDFRFYTLQLSKSTTHIFKTPNGHVQPLPYTSLKRQAMIVMLRYATALGITPESRARVNAIEESSGDDEILGMLLGNGKAKTKKTKGS